MKPPAEAESTPAATQAQESTTTTPPPPDSQLSKEPTSDGPAPTGGANPPRVDDAPRRLPSAAEAVATESSERARREAAKDPTKIFPLIAELDGTIGRAIRGQSIPDRDVVGGVDSRGWGEGIAVDGSKRIQSGRVSGRIALDGTIEFDEPGAGKVDLPFQSGPLALMEPPSLDHALRGHGHRAKLAPSVGIVGGSFDATEAIMLALGKDPHHLDKRRMLRSSEKERMGMRRASDAVHARRAVGKIRRRMDQLCRSLAADGQRTIANSTLDDKRLVFAELLEDCAQTRLGREVHDVILAAWRKCDPNGAPDETKTSESESARAVHD